MKEEKGRKLGERGRRVVREEGKGSVLLVQEGRREGEKGSEREKEEEV